MNKNIKFVQGNEAVAEAAMYAGLSFFAGYPITPSSEIAEILAKRLPENRGKFIQMEDEIASLCAIIGASLTGHKVMTATSGPGFSLMQEALGYAVMTDRSFRGHQQGDEKAVACGSRRPGQLCVPWQRP